MNERIKELAEQCATPERFDVAKFAELVVLECLGIVESEAAQYAEPVWAFEIVNDMKERFGVEE